jgi:DNA-binding NarL/FixJ family response regulator
LSEFRGVFVTISRLLTDIVIEVLSHRIDFELIAEVDTRDNLVERLRSLRPDIVIVGLFDGETDEIGSLILSAMPTIKVLAITSDQHDAFLYEMRPHRTVMSKFSLETLIAACFG